jgi:hypothetical protein
MEYWSKIVTEVPLPYYPNASMGWDSSPRTTQSDAFLNVGYPFTTCLNNNSPDKFKEALRSIKARMDSTGSPRILTINAWNEWTESSYLEPDTYYGMAYLEAIRDIFG